jgi:hypothetical protein
MEATTGAALSTRCTHTPQLRACICSSSGMTASTGRIVMKRLDRRPRGEAVPNSDIAQDTGIISSTYTVREEGIRSPPPLTGCVLGDMKQGWARSLAPAVHSSNT